MSQVAHFRQIACNYYRMRERSGDRLNSAMEMLHFRPKELAIDTRFEALHFQTQGGRTRVVRFVRASVREYQT